MSKRHLCFLRLHLISFILNYFWCGHASPRPSKLIPAKSGQVWVCLVTSNQKLKSWMLPSLCEQLRPKNPTDWYIPSWEYFCLHVLKQDFSRFAQKGFAQKYRVAIPLTSLKKYHNHILLVRLALFIANCANQYFSNISWSISF